MLGGSIERACCRCPLSGSSSWTSQRNRLIADVRWVTGDISTVSQQLQLPRRPSWAARVGMVTQHRPRHRQRIDRIRLAPTARRLAAWDISLVGTCTTCWPAASRSRSRRAPTCCGSPRCLRSAEAELFTGPHDGCGAPGRVAFDGLLTELATPLRRWPVAWLYLCASVPINGGCPFTLRGKC